MIKSDTHFFCAAMASGLQDRVVVVPFPATVTCWQMIYIQSGAANILGAPDDDNSQPTVIEAPVLLCRPVSRDRQLKFFAGSVGFHLAFDDVGMSSLLGNRPEAVDLRLMLGDFVMLPLGKSIDQDQQIIQALRTIEREVQGQNKGRFVMIEAHIRCLLVHFWRGNSHEGTPNFSDGPNKGVLRRFRQLLEINFRSRWRVADYANALGTTSDRLHNLATQTLGRAPLSLIHERTHREAKALLTRSHMTLEQIGAYLGFKTAAQFSAFFRTLEGVPPGQYRQRAAAKNAKPAFEQETSLTDWP